MHCPHASPNGGEQCMPAFCKDYKSTCSGGGVKHLKRPANLQTLSFVETSYKLQTPVLVASPRFAEVLESVYY